MTDLTDRHSRPATTSPSFSVRLLRVTNDRQFVAVVVQLLADAGFEVCLFGGWAEELLGTGGPRPHGDIDLLVIDADLGALDAWLRQHNEIGAKRLPHKRAVLLDGVLVEMFLVQRVGKGAEMLWWGTYAIRWPLFATRMAEGLPIAAKSVLDAFRCEHHLLPSGLWDHDFHPDETDVRIFVNPPDGILRRDDSVVVTEAHHGDFVLRHYAFPDRWFKINMTTDLGGRPAVHADDGFAFNCDIATPMHVDGVNIHAADLFLDVLVDPDGRSFVVTDRDEFTEAIGAGLVSRREAVAAEAHLGDLLAMIQGGELIRWLDAQCAFAPSPAPPALPIARGPITPNVAAGTRPSW